MEAAAAGQRLDQWLTARLGEEASRTLVQRWIRAGHVSGSNKLTPRYRISPGQVYVVRIPPPEPVALDAVDLELPVVYEDPDLAVIHKPAGIAVHPGPGDRRITIAHGILHLFPDWERSNLRPGIVHRLDRDTEGLLLVAKSEASRRQLSRQFAERTVEKSYTAYLQGTPPAGEGRVEAPIKRHPRHRTRMCVDPTGRAALTDYQIEETLVSRRGRKYCRADIQILTGRTHQIRVHMAHLGAPVVGDPLYSHNAAEFTDFGLLLLARELSFTQPRTQERLRFSLPLPERFQAFRQRYEQH